MTPQLVCDFENRSQLVRIGEGFEPNDNLHSIRRADRYTLSGISREGSFDPFLELKRIRVVQEIWKEGDNELGEV